MDFKDYARQPQKLASGQKSCSGCGYPIIVRMAMSAMDKPFVVCQGTGCISVTTTTWPYTSWKMPTIHSAFPNLASTAAGVETAIRAMKKKGKLKKDIKVVAFGGDGGTYDIGIQALSGAIERQHNILYICYDNQAYMNCLSLDTFVMTGEGLKRITNIKLGDMVYALDQKTHQLVLKKCTGIFDNGIKKVYEVKTLHHAIKATANHPFLVVKRNGRGKDSSFIWKTLEKLRKNDEIIILKRAKPGKSFKFKPTKISKLGDYKVNNVSSIKMPKKSSPELMEFLGLYVGDGWQRLHKGEVGFALPANTKARKRLIHLCKKIFKENLNESNKNYIYIYSINLARFIDSLNFGKGAKEKIVPDWVFTLPDSEKEAFIQGLMLSDGYKFGKSWRYVSASYDLLKTLRLLLQTRNYRVGKIHQQTKKKGTHCVYRELLEDSTYGYICFSKKKSVNVAKFRSQAKQRDFLIENEHFSTEKIFSINLIKKEPTIDLRVDGEHNFVADGIVVHNTGGQRSSASPYGAATATTPNGTLHHGKELFRKDFTQIIAAHDVAYVAQASIFDFADLTRKVKRAMEIDGFAFINILSPCVLFWKIATCDAFKISELAVKTNFWPLYEVDHGKWILNYKPDHRLQVEAFLKPQGRFKQLLELRNRHIIDGLQQRVDRKWKELLFMCEKTKAKSEKKEVKKVKKKEVAKKPIKKEVKISEPKIKISKTRSKLAKLKDKLKRKRK